MGRPSKLTPETQERICQGVRMGMTYQHAAQYGGVHRDTFNEWMKQGGKEENTVYSDFSDAVREAEGVGVAACMGRIQKAANKQWQAAAWILERRHPSMYGRHVVQQEITGTPTMEIRMPEEFRVLPEAQERASEDSESEAANEEQGEEP